MTKTLEISESTYEKIKDQLSDDEVVEIEDLDEMVGKKYAFQCARYIYYGKVKKVTSAYIELDEAQTIFETGEYGKKEPEDGQAMPKKKVYVMRQSIESIYPTNW